MIEVLSKKAIEYAKKIASSKTLSQEFLKSIGYLTPTGRVAKAYKTK